MYIIQIFLSDDVIFCVPSSAIFVPLCSKYSGNTAIEYQVLHALVQAVRKLLEIWNKWIDKKMASRKTKSDVEREKVIQNRCQELLKRMIQDEDNKYCVDCDAKGKE